MIQRGPIGTTKASGELESSKLQTYEWFTIGEPVNLVLIAISDRLSYREIVAFSTAC